MPLAFPLPQQNGTHRPPAEVSFRATVTLPDAAHPATDNYGTDATGGQLVGRDGKWDLVVSAPQTAPSSTLYVYQASTLQSTAPFELHRPDAGKSYWFGHPMSVPGDINGDGDDDLVVCDVEYTSDRALIYYGHRRPGQRRNNNGRHVLRLPTLSRSAQAADPLGSHAQELTAILA